MLDPIGVVIGMFWMSREDWIELSYKNVVDKISTSNQKLKQKEYLTSGKVSIVDQGQELIGGYTNDESKVLDCKLPVIVFGDHTKIVKVINFPFAPGADGTKVLQPKQFIDPKLLAFFTKILVFKIKDKGYARHYQHIEKIDLPLPPLPEQRAIVSKIEQLFSDLDNGIANLKTAQEQLKIYRQAVLKKAFEGELTKKWRAGQTDLPTAEELLEQIKENRITHYQKQLDDWELAVKVWEENGKEGKKPGKPKKLKEFQSIGSEELDFFSDLPLGWVRLGLFMDKIEAGKSFRCEERPPQNTEVGVAKVSAVTWGEYDEYESKTCRDESKINPEYYINKNDFLFSRANTIDLVGACVIVKKQSLKIMLSDKLLRFKFIFGDNSFYLYYLRSRFGRSEIKKKSTGNQDSMRNIGQDRIRSIITPLFSKQEQIQIVQEIESRLSVCDKVEETIKESLEKAEALRQSILKKAFEGNLLSEAELDACREEEDWEPADVLLERLKRKKSR